MRRLFALGCVLGLFAMTGRAGAANTVTISSTTKNGSVLRVTGESTFDNQPFIPVGADLAADAPPAFNEIGGDLTGVAMASTNNGNVMFRISVNFMPAFVSSTPATLYGWNFCVNGGSCYELVWTRITVDTASNNVAAPPRWYLSRCGDAACTPAQQVAVSNAAAQVFVTDKTAIMSVPLSAMNAAPGATITAKSVDAAGPVFSAVGGPHPSHMQRGSGDGLTTVSPFTVAGKEVSLGIGPRGQDPTAVTYRTTVLADENNFWGGNLDLTGLSGALEVYVRSCLGAGNCSYATRQVTI